MCYTKRVGWIGRKTRGLLMGEGIIAIHDSASGATAKVSARLGFNCFQFQVSTTGHTVNAIWAEPGFESGGKRASGSGIPILFPYPGRLRGKTLNWKGRQFRLEGNDGRGNAIHGFVHTRPWRVVEHTDGRVVGQFWASRDEPALADCWPGDSFRARMAIRVE